MGAPVLYLVPSAIAFGDSFINIMRKILITIFVLLISANSYAEVNPLKWASHQKLAGVFSNVTLGSNITLDTIDSLRHENKKHAILCQAARFGITAGAAELTKITVHRTRPDGSDRKSFFSGHTALSSVSDGLHDDHGKGYKAVTVSFSVSTAYFRGAADKHYISDTIVGFLVGLAAQQVCNK